MKLIDVEEACKEIERFKGYLDEDMIYRLKIAVKRLPIVEAIPTEWLNEWYWKNDDVCCDKRVSALFGKMIRDWRKENEI